MCRTSCYSYNCCSISLNSGTEVVRIIKSFSETKTHISFDFGLQFTNSYNKRLLKVKRLQYVRFSQFYLFLSKICWKKRKCDLNSGLTSNKPRHLTTAASVDHSNCIASPITDHNKCYCGFRLATSAVDAHKLRSRRLLSTFFVNVHSLRGANIGYLALQPLSAWQIYRLLMPRIQPHLLSYLVGLFAANICVSDIRDFESN